MPTIIGKGKDPYQRGQFITDEEEILGMLRQRGLVGYLREVLSSVGYDLQLQKDGYEARLRTGGPAG